MEIKKPQPFIGSSDCATAHVKQVLINHGLLAPHPEQYWDKITEDFMLLGAFTTLLPPEETSNRLSVAISQTLMTAYWTLLRTSKYQIDARHYLDVYMANFKTLMDGDGIESMLLTTALSLGEGMNDVVDKIMENNTILFMEKYSREQWPEIVAEIGSMTPEQLKAKLDALNTNQNNPTDESN